MLLGPNSVEEIQILPQGGTNWEKINLTNNPSQVVISITLVLPPDQGTTAGRMGSV